MTVSTTTIKNSYSGNGSATAFNYTFKIFASAELLVYIRTTATGAETLKTVTTHYTVSGIGDTGGGTVTFTSGNVPTSAQQVILVRATPLTQSTDYVENDPFPASSHEDALDKLTHQMQEQQEELDRSFKVSKTVTDLSSSEVVDDAATRASKLLGFSSNGASFAYYANASTDVEVAAIAGLTSAANKMIRYTGSGTADLIDFLDQDDMSSNSASAVPSQQSVVAYVAAQITAEDLDVTSDSGTIAIDLNSAVLTVAGGTGLSSAASGTTVTLNIDSTVTTLTGSQTLTNKTLTSPTLTTPKFVNGGFIADANGNELIKMITSSSAVNELSVTNAATGGAVSLSATGGDTNIDLTLTPKGSGEVNIAAGNLNYAGTAITATGAELNILDGVTSTAAELNILDGVTATATELNLIDGVTATTAELNYSDTGAAVGTVVASKVVTADANKDVASFRNITLTGELDAATLDISGNADIDGTTNLDAVDIDGAVQIDGATTFGVDDTGVDVKFFGATSGQYMLWDESANALSFTDNAALLMGAGGDLKIFHNGSNSQINDLSTGNLQLLSNGAGVDIMKTDGEYMAKFATDGAVTLYHDNTARLATTSGGVNVTGSSGTIGYFESSQAATNVSNIVGNATQTNSSANLVLQVNGGTTAQALVRCNGDNSMAFFNGASPTEKIRLLSDGKFGIGTTAASELLHLNGSNCGIRLEEPGGYDWRINNDGGNLNFSSDDPSAWSDKMTLTNSGNVGIGVTPTIDSALAGLSIGGKVLHVHDGSGASLKLSDAASGANRGVGLASVGVESALINCEAGDFRFGTGNQEKMRIDHSSGGVAIGVTAAEARLHVVGDASGLNDGTIALLEGNNDGGNRGIHIGQEGSGSQAWPFIQSYHSQAVTNYWELLLNPYGGNVAIGNSDPSETLDITGSFNATSSIKSLGVYNNTTGTAANLVVDSAGSFARSTSSRRYKNTITDATNGLTELLALRPVTYKHNGNGDTVFGGLIAEEVHDAGLTEFVQYNDDDEPDALAYGNMVSLCIKAIQEQQEKIEALEARITTLEGN